MKAVIYQKYGSPGGLEACEIQKPVPGGDEVLVKIRAFLIRENSTYQHCYLSGVLPTHLPTTSKAIMPFLERVA